MKLYKQIETLEKQAKLNFEDIEKKNINFRADLEHKLSVDTGKKLSEKYWKCKIEVEQNKEEIIKMCTPDECDKIGNKKKKSIRANTELLNK